MGVKIERAEKNLMRSRLETVLQMHKELDGKIEEFEHGIQAEDYRRFWKELRANNSESIKTVSRYMVSKCNR